MEITTRNVNDKWVEITVERDEATIKFDIYHNEAYTIISNLLGVIEDLTIFLDNNRGG